MILEKFEEQMIYYNISCLFLPLLLIINISCSKEQINVQHQNISANEVKNEPVFCLPVEIGNENYRVEIYINKDSDEYITNYNVVTRTDVENEWELSRSKSFGQYSVSYYPPKGYEVITIYNKKYIYANLIPYGIEIDSGVITSAHYVLYDIVNGNIYDMICSDEDKTYNYGAVYGNLENLKDQERENVLAFLKEKVNISNVQPVNYFDPITYLNVIGKDELFEWNAYETVVYMDFNRNELKKVDPATNEKIVQKTKFDYRIIKGNFIQKDINEYIFSIHCVDKNSSHLCNWGQMSTVFLFDENLNIVDGPFLYSNVFEIKEMTDIDQNGLNEIFVNSGGYSNQGYTEEYIDIFTNDFLNPIFRVPTYEEGTGSFLEKYFEKETIYKIEYSSLILTTTETKFMFINENSKNVIDINKKVHKYKFENNKFYHTEGELNFLQ